MTELAKELRTLANYIDRGEKPSPIHLVRMLRRGAYQIEARDRKQEWQPIETAPDDAVIILQDERNHPKVAVGYFDHRAAGHYAKDGGVWMMMGDDGLFSEAEPTHYQLMPPPMSDGGRDA